jgi:hypothetical protein
MDRNALHGATDDQIDVANERQPLRLTHRDEAVFDDAIVANAACGFLGADLRSSMPVIGFDELDCELANEHRAALADVFLRALVGTEGVSAVERVND